MWHSTSQAGTAHIRTRSTRRGDTVSPDTVYPLSMSAHLNYLPISYYITEKESEKKNPPNWCEEEMNRETLRFLIPPKAPW